MASGSAAFAAPTSEQKPSALYEVGRTVALPAQATGYGEAIAIDPELGVIYAVNRAAGEVYVYDEATLSLQSTITVPDAPFGIAVGPTGVIYVSQYTGTLVPGSVAVILPGATAPTISLPTGRSPHGVTVSNDGTRLWVGNRMDRFASVFDLTAPAAPVPLFDMPTPEPLERIVESPDGAALFAISDVAGVTRHDASTGALQATWNVPQYPHDLAFNRGSDQALVTDQLGTETGVFFSESGMQAASLELPGSYYTASDAARGTTLLTQAAAGTVTVLDTEDFAPRQTLTGVPGAFDVVVNPITHRVFVSSLNQHTLTELVPSAPEVTGHPNDAAVAEGDEVAFTAAATGGLGSLTTQWESSTDGGTTWAPIDAAIDPTLSLGATTLAHHRTEYRAVFTDAGGRTAISNSASLTVNARTVSPDPDPKPTPKPTPDPETTTPTPESGRDAAAGGDQAGVSRVPESTTSAETASRLATTGASQGALWSTVVTSAVACIAIGILLLVLRRRAGHGQSTAGETDSLAR